MSRLLLKSNSLIKANNYNIEHFGDFFFDFLSLILNKPKQKGHINSKHRYQNNRLKPSFLESEKRFQKNAMLILIPDMLVMISVMTKLRPTIFFIFLYGFYGVILQHIWQLL